jgi:meromycolic acid enoyl-[acyl-carrier-protein] reductase
MPGILEGKKILVTGVLTPASIAFAIAELAQREGADIVLTSFGRAMSLTEKSARRMQPSPDILEMDVNNPAQVSALAESIKQRWGRLDGFVHAIAFAPADALGGNFMTTPWESVQTAFQTSAYSLKAMAQALNPLMVDGGSIVTLDFDNSTQAWPFYDWMGVCKAALESVTRYLARDLGKQRIRVNALAAGPLKTMAAKGIPGFERFETTWGQRAPLGWDSTDRTPVAKMACVLLSDYSIATTGEIVHVDGGYHAMGAEVATEPPD